ncbi:stage V sporulation protein AB, partial [Bacillus safensis]
MIGKWLFVVLVGLGGGLTVGAGFVAFLTVLGIIPRLMQLTKTHRFIQG